MTPFAHAFAYAIKKTPYAFFAKITLCMYILCAQTQISQFADFAVCRFRSLQISQFADFVSFRFVSQFTVSQIKIISFAAQLG